MYAGAIAQDEYVAETASRRKTLRIAVGIVLAFMTVPTVLVITQMIIKSKWQLQMEYLWYNLVLFFLILLLIILVLGNITWSVIVFSALLILPAVISQYVKQFRGKPLTIFDVLGIRTALNVASGYVVRLSPRLGLCLLALLLFLTLQIRFQTIRLPGTRRAGIVRALTAFLTVIVIYEFCDKALWTEKWLQAGDDYVLLNTYAQKGFYPKLLSALGYLHIDKPEQYGEKKIEEIIKRESLRNSDPLTSGNADKDRNVFHENDTNTDDTVRPENLIVIMNESFADLSMFGDIHSDKDILPYYHLLKSGNGIWVQKGVLHVPVFGGVTANSEYEVLTGNSMQFLPGNVAAYEVYVRDPEYGLTTTLKDQGYRTVAIHPGWNNAWNRKQVFPKMGFEDIYFRANWGEEYETLRGKMTDKEAYHKIEKIYENKEPGEKLFTFCVTIQNHGGYSLETAEGYEPSVHLNYEEEYPETELYFSLLRESDHALWELLNHFAEINERTMIVFFGDHQVAPDLDAFFAQNFEKQVEESTASEAEALQKRYMTPLLIWTNYNPGKKTLQLMQEELDISANFLGSYLLELAGLDMSPYNRLLLELMDKMPVMGQGMYQTSDGQWILAGETAECGSSLDFEDLLRDYRIMQYNNVLDWRNRKDSGFVINNERSTG